MALRFVQQQLRQQRDKDNGRGGGFSDADISSLFIKVRVFERAAGGGAPLGEGRKGESAALADATTIAGPGG